jgi:hypothetical protein
VKRLLAIFSLVLFGCPSEQEPATGNLDRPSGLAYVARTDTRADLFIADTEAGGVKILQMLKQTTTDSDGATEIRDVETFVRSTALFFPHVIPAPRVPTRVAISSNGQRLYTISPTDRTLHVIDAGNGNEPYPAVASQVSSFKPLAAPIELGPRSAIAVDVSVVARSSGGDVVLVAFDRFAEPSGLLLAYPTDENGVVLTATVGSATIAGSPRRISVRTAGDPSILVSSAATSNVSLVPIDLATGGLGSMIALDAGGPTGDVADAAAGGAVALRLDLNAVVIFDPTPGAPGGLVRSTRERDLRTPFSPRGVGPPGIAFLWPSPPVRASAATGIEELPKANAREGDESRIPTSGVAVIVVHADTRASFLIGTPLVPALSGPAIAGRIDALPPPASGGPAIEIAECTFVTSTCPERVDDAAKTPENKQLQPPSCSSEVFPDPTAPSRNLRVVYRGTLARERGGTLVQHRTIPTSFELTPGRIDLEARDVRPGDRAVVYAEISTDPGFGPCPGGDRVRTVEEGVILGVGGGALTVELAATSTIVTRKGNCDDAIQLVEYELFAGGEELVVTERSTGVVESRLAVSSSSVTVDVGVRFTVRATPGFACRPPVPEKTLCSSPLDCGGADCKPSGLAECPGTCAPVAGCPKCYQFAPARDCSGVELDVDGARLDVLSTGVEGGGEFAPAVPDDLVFSPMRRRWIISQPGARGLSEAHVPGSGSFVTRAIR